MAAEAAGGDDWSCACAKKRVSVTVRRSSGQRVRVEARVAGTIEELKGLVSEWFDVPVASQKLIHKGRILENDRSVGSYGIKEGQTIFLIRAFVPSGAVLVSPTATPAAPVAADAGSSDIAGAGLSLFPTGTISPPTANPPVEGDSLVCPTEAAVSPPAVSPDAANEGQSDSPLYVCTECINAGAGIEEIGRRLADSEEVYVMPSLDDILFTPEMLRTLILANPRIREMAEQNPLIGRVVNDMELLRLGYEICRNPAIMDEVLRSSDRAIRNIESSPHGFNILRQVYEDLNEPFLDAIERLGSLRYGRAPAPLNHSDARPDHAGSASDPNREPLPNPWADGAKPQAGNTRLVPVAAGGLPYTSLTDQQSSHPAPAQQASALGAAQPDEVAEPNSQMNLSGGVAAGRRNVPNAYIPPEELYEAQLDELRNMGFHDAQENIRALRATEGDVQAAVLLLRRNMGPPRSFV